MVQSMREARKNVQMSMIPSLIKKLRDLEKKATGSKSWKVEDYTSDMNFDNDWINKPGACWIKGPKFVQFDESYYFSRNDAKFVTEARNKLPALLDAIEFLLEEIELFEIEGRNHVEINPSVLYARCTATLTKVKGMLSDEK